MLIFQDARPPNKLYLKCRLEMIKRDNHPKRRIPLLIEQAASLLFDALRSISRFDTNLSIHVTLFCMFMFLNTSIS